MLARPGDVSKGECNRASHHTRSVCVCACGSVQVARSVAGSHLAKAAMFGHDPNWGRLAAAAGYSGVQFDQRDLGVQLGSTVLMEKGQPLPFDKAVANKYLKVSSFGAE